MCAYTPGPCFAADGLSISAAGGAGDAAGGAAVPGAGAGVSAAGAGVAAGGAGVAAGSCGAAGGGCEAGGAAGSWGAPQPIVRASASAQRRANDPSRHRKLLIHRIIILAWAFPVTGTFTTTCSPTAASAEISSRCSPKRRDCRRQPCSRSRARSGLPKRRSSPIARRPIPTFACASLLRRSKCRWPDIPSSEARSRWLETAPSRVEGAIGCSA